ncbi:MAG: ChaN family lipoprotein [Candidatus Manganitrophus sp.]|nr:MAG: ChaN family lipoprotein [Candidatus Manganitrophus sp.]
MPSTRHLHLFSSLTVVFLFLALGCAGPGRSKEQSKAASNPHSTRPASTPVADAPTTPPAEESLAAESPYIHLDEIEEGKIVHVPTGVAVSKERLIDFLTPARIIYVGEVHDNLEDHRVQLEILQAMNKRFPGKVAVGMEMFRRPAQPQLNQWLEGNLSDKDFRKLWIENWGMEMGYYQELLNFIKENKIPLVALNAPQDWEAKVGMKGIDALSPEDKKALPQIDRTDRYHRQALQAIFTGHGPMGRQDGGGFSSFYDTMLLWDETMAESVARYLTSPEGGDKKMVVFAGGFHVGYGFGIPRRAFRRLPEPYQIVIPNTQEVPEAKRFQVELKLPDFPLHLADFIWGVGYSEVEAKKVRLGVMIEPFQAGVRITDVSPNSTAEAAGIQQGDIVVSFDGEEMREPFDLTYAVGQKSPGDRVKMKLLRDGKVIETEAEMKPSRHP